MSTAFSKKMQGVTTRLLGKYGSAVTLVRAGAKVWDADLGEYVPQPDTSIPLTSVPVPVNVGLVNGTTIQAGDMVVKADYGVLPKMEDKVDFAGARWSVVGIETKMVNDDIIAWFIQVRK
ncbi:head-to-tail stopper [Pantoea phage AH01]|nr:head-to-tail stopper [Pantoea phage AH01]